MADLRQATAQRAYTCGSYPCNGSANCSGGNTGNGAGTGAGFMPPIMPPAVVVQGTGASGACGGVAQFPSMSKFPETGNLHILYVDLSTNLLYIWNGEEYINVPAKSGVSAEIPQYDSIDDFPEEGEVGKIYIDKSKHTIYYWDGNEYMKLTGGSTNADCDCGCDCDDACLWNNILNGGSADLDTTPCPYPDHNHGEVSDGCGCCGGTNLTPEKIIEGLGYTPASEKDVADVAAKADEALKVATETKVPESVLKEIRQAAKTANNAKNVADEAKKTAATADRHATQAQNLAEAAEDEADEAKEIAAEAKSIAEEAKKIAQEGSGAGSEVAEEAKKIVDEAKELLDSLKDTLDKATQTAEEAKSTAGTAALAAIDAKKAAEDVGTKLGNLEKQIANNKKEIGKVAKDIEAVQSKVDDFENSLKDVDGEITKVQQAIEDIQDSIEEQIGASTWKLLQIVELTKDEQQIAFTNLNCRKIYASCTLCGSDENDTHQRLEIRLNEDNTKHRIATLERAVPASSRDTRYTNLYAHALNTNRVGGYIQKDSDYPDTNFILQALSTRSAKNEEINFGTEINNLYFTTGNPEGKLGRGTKIVLYGIKSQE